MEKVMDISYLSLSHPPSNIEYDGIYFGIFIITIIFLKLIYTDSLAKVKPARKYL